MKRFFWHFLFFGTIVNKNRDGKEYRKYRNVLLQASFTCQVGNKGNFEQQKIEFVFSNYHYVFDKLTQKIIQTQPPPPILTGTGHVQQIKRTFLIILNRTKMNYLNPWWIYQLIHTCISFTTFMMVEYKKDDPAKHLKLMTKQASMSEIKNFLEDIDKQPLQSFMSL